MSKKILALILMSICVTGVSACSNKNNIEAIKNITETKIEEKSETMIEDKKEEKSTEVKENITNRYSVAGIDDAAEFEKVFDTVKSFVAKGEKEKVAEYVNYPLTSANITVNSKEEFIKNYDSIITEDVKNALINQNVEETFVNYKGVMVGNGQIWFSAIYDNNSKIMKYLIYAVNQL